ncbi:hypothetical protein [Baaleninema sp.]|uniref:hypothetical protein n=1 Tax=Baaleninema sp. TaxID=3101197 RepID=UPI003D0317C0
MEVQIGNFLARVRSWFPKAQAKLKEQAAELEAKFSDADRIPLNFTLRQKLIDRLLELDSPNPYCEEVRSILSQRLKQWQQDETAPNGLAVLGSPVEVLPRLLENTLFSWGYDGVLLIKTVTEVISPHDVSATIEQLRQTVESEFMGSIDRNLVMVIPDLSRCFLRCVDGLDSIDVLQEYVLRDRSRFWLMGCDRWAWNYLDRICNLSVSFPEPVALPPLSPEELKIWLSPVCHLADCQFEKEPENGNFENGELEEDFWNSKPEKSYFHRLAELSLGSAAVAANLWLRSLHHLEGEAGIFAERPQLPELPLLTKDDRFLLYSLGLHRKTSVEDLAKTLGDTPLEVFQRVRRLQSSSLIRQQEELWELEPAHYPRLYRDLSNNQFRIGDLKS